MFPKRILISPTNRRDNILTAHARTTRGDNVSRFSY